MYRKFIKRILDLSLSTILLIILSPLLIIISISIILLMGWPVFFIQERPGLNEKPFKIYKFRSMLEKFDSKGNLLPDKQRITKFGTILRNTSIDEFPELINVIKGQMSIVGPRPLIFRYLPYYSERERKRHNVLPGITGLAQINGRNYVDWDKRLELDVQYVENMTFWLDLRIIFKTLLAVIKQEGTGLHVLPDLDVQRIKKIK